MDRPNPGNIPRRQFSARPQPQCAQAAPDCWRCSGHQGGGGDAVLRPLPTKNAVGGLGRAAEPAARHGITGWRPLLGRLQSQKKASAGTEAVQRKEEKYDLATIAHDRVIQRQFLVIGQGPGAAAIIEHALDFDGRYGVHTARRR